MHTTKVGLLLVVVVVVICVLVCLTEANMNLPQFDASPIILEPQVDELYQPDQPYQPVESQLTMDNIRMGMFDAWINQGFASQASDLPPIGGGDRYDFQEVMPVPLPDTPIEIDTPPVVPETPIVPDVPDVPAVTPVVSETPLIRRTPLVDPSPEVPVPPPISSTSSSASTPTPAPSAPSPTSTPTSASNSPNATSSPAPIVVQPAEAFDPSYALLTGGGGSTAAAVLSSSGSGDPAPSSTASNAEASKSICSYSCSKLSELFTGSTCSGPEASKTALFPGKCVPLVEIADVDVKYAVAYCQKLGYRCTSEDKVFASVYGKLIDKDIANEIVDSA